MKKHISTVIMVLCCIISAVCLIRIGELKNEIRNLEWTVNDRMQDVQNQVWNITNEIENALEQQANLLSESGWEFAEIAPEDIQADIANVKCYVVPKEYHPENTKAYIYCNNKAYPMVLEDGRYKTEIQVPFFKESIVERVQFEENGEIKNEVLDWWLNPKENLLPAFYSDGPGYSLSYKDDYAQLKYSSDINIHIEHMGHSYEKQAIFIAAIDGKKVYEQTIELDNPIHSDKYADIYITEKIDGSFDLKYGSELESYIQFKDGNGLVYHYILEKLVLEKDGKNSEMSAIMDGCDIYKADGTPLLVLER